MTEVESGGRKFAAQIVEKFGTDDVFSIAESVGVRIVHENWFPVTFGEFDKKQKTICVNLNAPVSQIKIIAHELGHFFARDLNLTAIEEEAFAHEFAEHLATGRE